MESRLGRHADASQRGGCCGWDYYCIAVSVSIRVVGTLVDGVVVTSKHAVAHGHAVELVHVHAIVVGDPDTVIRGNGYTFTFYVAHAVAGGVPHAGTVADAHGVPDAARVRIGNVCRVAVTECERDADGISDARVNGLGGTVELRDAFDVVDRDVLGIDVAGSDCDGCDYTDTDGDADVIADGEPDAHRVPDARGHANFQPYAVALADGLADREQDADDDAIVDSHELGHAVVYAHDRGVADVVPFAKVGSFAPRLALAGGHGQCVSESQVM